jgi:hypothetical protein
MVAIGLYQQKKGFLSYNFFMIHGYIIIAQYPPMMKTTTRF